MRFVVVIGLMEETLHQLRYAEYLPNQLVQDLFHQPYDFTRVFYPYLWMFVAG